MLVGMSMVVRAVGFMAVIMVMPPAQVVMSVAGVKYLHLDEVEDEAKHGNNEHNVALNV